MAKKWNPDTAPKLDGAVSDYQPTSAALTGYGFGTLVRCVKMGRIDNVNQLNDVVNEKLDVLGLDASSIKAVPGIPEGSDQFDVGGFVTWIGKIQEEDDDAVDQLLTIAATIKARLS